MKYAKRKKEILLIIVKQNCKENKRDMSVITNKII